MTMPAMAPPEMPEDPPLLELPESGLLEGEGEDVGVVVGVDVLIGVVVGVVDVGMMVRLSAYVRGAAGEEVTLKTSPSTPGDTLCQCKFWSLGGSWRAAMANVPRTKPPDEPLESSKCA